MMIDDTPAKSGTDILAFPAISALQNVTESSSLSRHLGPRDHNDRTLCLGA